MDSSDSSEPEHPNTGRGEYRRRQRRRRARSQLIPHVSDSSHEGDDSENENESQFSNSPGNHSEDSGENIPSPEGNQIMEGARQEVEAVDIYMDAGSENEVQEEEAVIGVQPHLVIFESEHSESASDSDAGQDRAHESGDDSASESSAASDDSDNNNVVEENDCLFEGSPLSVGEYMLAILIFFMRHKLTGVCLNDFLSLIALMCPPENKCIKTLHLFKKYFSMLGKSLLKFHYYCANCESPLQENEACLHCGEGQRVDYFLELPLLSQLQSMFQRPGFYEALQFRFHREKKFAGNIEDIYDAQIYKDEVRNGFLNNPHNISFMWYSDGISIFKSSNFSVWPMYLVINELNYKMRTKRENIVFAGIWFGAKKTNPNVFLAPLHSDLTTFESDGHLFERAGGDPVLVKGKMLCCTCDLQAKCRFMRMMQWNSYYGCTYCLIRSRRYNIGVNSSVQVYPYSPVTNVRNNLDVPRFDEQALRNRQHDAHTNVYGVKGLSLLFFMLPNMIKCMGMDAMHGLTGVIKQLTSCWFDASYAEEPFSVHHLLNIVDERLKILKPPSNVQKMPRSIKTDIALWKCLEYKLWLFYYSLPVLLDILPEVYWNHHCKLVCAMALLHQESISPEQINSARDLLHSYLTDFENLYGLRFMSLNVHQLIHFPDVVESLGPLWVYNCFFFEDLNGQIASLVHGTRHAAKQICSSVSAFLTLPANLNALPYNNAVRKFGAQLLISGQTQLRIAFEINPSLCVVGFFSRCHPIPALIRDALNNGFNLVNGRCQYFQKLKKKGDLYVAASYERDLQKVSNYAVIRGDNGTPHLCKIKYFVRWSPCNQACVPKCDVCPPRFFAIVELFERIPWNVHYVPDVRMSYLDRVRPTGDVRAFPVQSLSALCFYITVDDVEYIASPINNLETE